MRKIPGFLIIFSFLVFVLSFSTEVNAQTCSLIEVRVDKIAAKTGEEITVVARGKDCIDWEINFGLWERGFGLPAVHKYVQNLGDATFNNQNTATLTWLVGSNVKTGKYFVEGTAGTQKKISQDITISSEVLDCSKINKCSDYKSNPSCVADQCTKSDNKTGCRWVGLPGSCSANPVIDCGKIKNCRDYKDVGFCNEDQCKVSSTGCFYTPVANVCNARITSPGGESKTQTQPKPGQPQEVAFEITPPGGYETIQDLVSAIARWVFNLGIPIAVIIIVWAGLRMMLARGDETEFAEAKKMLWYAIIGLAIIFIGQGFVSLVKSILELGK